MNNDKKHPPIITEDQEGVPPEEISYEDLPVTDSPSKKRK